MGDRQAVATCDKKVYLTYDDGIHPGTQEVYDVIKAKGVKATFFLTGAHTQYAVDHSRQIGLLRALNGDGNIDLGNHSSSHANQYYEGFYTKGGVLLNDGTTRRSVLEDFRRCDRTLGDLLGRPGHKWKYARLPGRNTWRAVPGVADETSGTNLISTGDSDDEANALKADGYQIYGWDYEWRMDFSGTNNHSDYDPEVDRACTSATDTVCFSEAEHRRSFRFNTNLDRPRYDGATAANEVMGMFNARFWGGPRKTGKLIVLMHERAFREHREVQIGPPREPRKYVKYLEDFIDALKQNGVCFEKISDY